MNVKYLRFFALSLLVFCSAQARLQAQNVYRCGNSYSQTPCPGSMPVDVADDRSKTQKAQADAASQRDRRTAEAMEKSRLKQEASQARTAGVKSGGPGAGQPAAPGDQAPVKHKPRAGKKGVSVRRSHLDHRMAAMVGVRCWLTRVPASDAAATPQSGWPAASAAA